MQDWFDAMTNFEKVFWYIAIPFSVLLLIQMIMTFIGMGGDSVDGDMGSDVPDVDMDADMEIDISDSEGTEAVHYGADYPGFDIFTIRGFIAFFTMFGWSGVMGIDQGWSKLGVLIFASCMGFAMMLLIAALFYFISRLADSGTMDIRNALNQVGNVYIPIKGNGESIGKIQVNIQDSLREMRAITKKENDLPTGTVVRVTGIVSGNILVVEKFNESK